MSLMSIKTRPPRAIALLLFKLNLPAAFNCVLAGESQPWCERAAAGEPGDGCAQFLQREDRGATQRGFGFGRDPDWLTQNIG